jgi:pimeloyl-ACP methyl ester carboxylesterase
MDNPRIYGSPPFSVAVVHGGPGAPGTMALVARRLSRNHGILEPLQTADSVDGQVEELAIQLKQWGESPFTLIGSSWGAMLSFILAARFPGLVGKLIMVGSGPFEASNAEDLMAVRLKRLQPEDRGTVISMINILADDRKKDKDEALRMLGDLCTKADAYNPVSLDTEALAVNAGIYEKVWPQVEELRACGRLLALGRQIKCPVVAIHGDYDPHSAVGVEQPLSRVLTDFRFILLPHCGHLPWIEREARDLFFEILEQEMSGE